MKINNGAVLFVFGLIILLVAAFAGLSSTTQDLPPTVQDDLQLIAWIALAAGLAFLALALFCSGAPSDHERRVSESEGLDLYDH